MVSELRFGFGGDEQEVAAHVQSLASWLRDTENLARAEIKELSAPARAGMQGSGADVVQVVAANAAVFAAAVAAFGNWLLERSRRGSVMVKVLCPNGCEVSATVRGNADVAAVKSKLLSDCGE